ncbi:MAG: hypothetical protein H6823_03285 [Planctomycetaceae bacterium]|nr:hypothetical protein [Planctomycetales bacterium]MCB9937242.1 hypothetical protein [Planctomycetaceae bacterium]
MTGRDAWMASERRAWMPGARTNAAKPSGQWATPSAGQGSGETPLNVQVRMTNEQEKVMSSEKGSDGRSAKDGEQTPNVELPTPSIEGRRLTCRTTAVRCGAHEAWMAGLETDETGCRNSLLMTAVVSGAGNNVTAQ